MEHNNPQISIIVPVYNVERYLDQCVHSILNQDFTDFELLLIDDGSKDRSGQICDAYAKEDRRVRVFHKENGGVSAARNLGIDNASGQYVTFIDSDDYVDTDYLSILMGGRNSDLTVTGYAKLGEGRKSGFGSLKKEYSFKKSEYTAQQFKVCLPSLLDETPMRSPWVKLFKLAIIRNNKIYFDSSIRIAEDAVFVQTYLLYCHSISFQEGTAYHYRVEEDNNSCFKFSLLPDEYVYTLHTTLQAYEKIAHQFNFTSPDFYNNTNKLMLMLLFRGTSKNGFTLKGYADYKRAIKMLLPEVDFSDKLYILCYALLRKKLYLLSFLLLRYVYPLKIWLGK